MDKGKCMQNKWLVIGALTQFTMIMKDCDVQIYIISNSKDVRLGGLFKSIIQV